MAQDLRRSQSESRLARRRGYEGYTSPFGLSPFQLMRHLSEEMDRLWGGSSQETSMWRPAIDVREHEGKLLVHAELPGVDDKDVKVSVENDTLILQGERKREEEREEDGWYRAERSYGSFYRAIPLPQGAEADKAQAKFNNGVLEIEMPIPKAQQQTRQIPISSGSHQQQAPQVQQSTEKVGRAGGS